MVPGPLILNKYNLHRREYILMTIHRAENTNSKEKLIALIRACEVLSKETENLRIILPIHPRTANFLKRMNLYVRLKECRAVRLIRPVGYVNFIALMRSSEKVLTDSGGYKKNPTYRV